MSNFRCWLESSTRSNLLIRCLPDFHHPGAPVLLRSGSVGTQAFHLRLLGLQNSLHFRLLVGCEAERASQHLGSSRRIEVTLTLSLSLRGCRVRWLIVTPVVLCVRKASAGDDDSRENQWKQEIFAHDDFSCDCFLDRRMAVSIIVLPGRQREAFYRLLLNSISEEGAAAASSNPRGKRRSLEQW